MLTKLLRRVAQGGVHSTVVLARELDVSEGLLAQMIDDLVRMGYLKPVSGGCEGQCDACPLAGGCAIGGPGGIWTMTEKGMRAAVGYTRCSRSQSPDGVAERTSL